MFAANKLRKNSYFKTAVALALVIGIVVASWFSLRLALNTDYPIVNVESGSMCISYGINCDGFSHPFDQTLHIGDMLILQGIQPEDLNANYPNSDIIVYRDPSNNRLIVHRIVKEQSINSTLYFKTKGDANGPTFWPDIPNYYDDIPDSKGVPPELIVGKVVARVPWVGWIPLILKSTEWGLPLVIVLILLLLAVELILPKVRGKKETAQQKRYASLFIDVFIKLAFDKGIFKAVKHEGVLVCRHR